MAVPLVAGRAAHAPSRAGAFSTYLHRAILAGVLVIPLLAFAIDRGMIYPMVTARNFAFRALVEVLLGAYIPLALANPRYRPRPSALLVTFAALVAWIGLATLLSDDPARSFWSTLERMGGYVTLLHLFALFIVLSAVLDTFALWQRLFEVSVVVGAAVAIHVIFEYMTATDLGRVKGLLGNALYDAAFLLFNIFLSLLLFVADAEKRPFSRYKLVIVSTLLLVTVGASLALLHSGRVPVPAFVNGLLLVTVAAGLIFAWLPERTYFLAYLAAALIIQIAGMLVTEARGPILGLIAGLAMAGVSWRLLIRSGNGPLLSRRSVAFGLAISVVLIGCFLIVRLAPGLSELPGLRRITAISPDDSTTAARLILWSMAWQGLLARPFTGWGPDNFDSVFDRFYNPAMFRATPLEPWYDSPHNLFLEFVVAGGIPAFLLIAALFLILARAFFRAHALRPAARAIMLGLLTAYGVHCLVGLNDLHGWLSLVVIAAFAQTLTVQRPYGREDTSSTAERNLIWVVPTTLGLALAAAYGINAPGIANARGLFRAVMLENPAAVTIDRASKNLAAFTDVLAGAPLGRQEATQRLLEFAFFLGTRPDGSVDPQALISAYDAAHAAALRMIAERPYDARLEFRLGQFLNRFGQSEEAAQHLERASALAPTQQPILLELGINTYLRAHDGPAALPVLRRAFQLQPRNIEARTAYALALQLSGQDSAAAQVLTGDIDAVSVAEKSRLLKSYPHAFKRLELRLAWGAQDPQTQSALASLRSSVKLGATPPAEP